MHISEQNGTAGGQIRICKQNPPCLLCLNLSFETRFFCVVFKMSRHSALH